MSENIQISGKLDQDDLNEVGSLTRSKLYWPKILLTNWYGLAILLLMVWGTITQVLRRDTTHLPGLALFWLVAAAIVAWAFYRSRRSFARDYQALSQSSPDFVTIAPDGVHFDGPSGARAFSPWMHYKEWRKGGRVILLDRSIGVGGFSILPIANLQPADLETLQGLLRTYLPNRTAPAK